MLYVPSYIFQVELNTNCLLPFISQNLSFILFKLHSSIIKKIVETANLQQHHAAFWEMWAFSYKIARNCLGSLKIVTAFAHLINSCINYASYFLYKFFNKYDFSLNVSISNSINLSLNNFWISVESCIAKIIHITFEVLTYWDFKYEWNSN